jgi:predicted AlkP superfamily pyrophosphatase or phosphodiesterase
MKNPARRVVVLNLVGLTPSHLEDRELTPNLNRIAAGGSVSTMKPPFPPVTGTVQTTLTTGYEPNRHGIISNGRYDLDQRKVTMWEQTAVPIEGERIWDILKRYDSGAKSAVLFWQYIKYATADILITPSPIHLEQGMKEWYFSKPAGWYEEVAANRGPFQLHSFWGPLASLASSEWIASAALDTLRAFDPTLTLVYLPNLDYQAQRFGPASSQARQSVIEIDDLVGRFVKELAEMGKGEDTALVLLSEYAIHPVERPVCINRILREHGWLKVNRIDGKEYIDLYHSKAFALVDHQVAHIYVQDNIEDQVKGVLEEINGIDQVWGEIGKRQWRLDHPRSGQLVAVAERDSWFPYYWWHDSSDAPPFAQTVDIHRKPGYDPMELFVDPKTRTIPLNPELIKGSHGVPPTTNNDWVSIIATGPSTELLDSKSQWEARDISTFLLNLLGHKT